jgi:acyl carrier protein
MSAGTPVLNGQDLGLAVQRIVAEVLMVRQEDVRPESALVRDLGAESIDFLDFVFRLEQALGKRIPVARWGDFVKRRLAGQKLSSAITTEVLREFAEEEAAGRT